MPSKKKTKVSEQRTVKHLDSESDDESIGDLKEEDFEDPFVDEFEEEIPYEADEEKQAQEEDISKYNDDDMQDIEEEKAKPFVPNVDKIEADEKLEFSNSAYTMFHRTQVEWPCLSFDIIRDDLGYNRTQFPATCYIVAGTQADRPENNKIFVLKMSELHQTQYDSDDEEEPDDVEILDDDPILESKYIKHKGDINRIRSMPQNSAIVAAWSSTKAVTVWNISNELKELSTRRKDSNIKPQKPIFTCNLHQDEGFAMNWSTLREGLFATGDRANKILLWYPRESKWQVDKNALVGHTSSVEDIKWSPNEEHILASASADGTIRIWDARKKGCVLTFRASKVDVNCISWNPKATQFIVSGDDNGVLRIWDMRAVTKSKNLNEVEPVGQFTYHRDQITSVEWAPNDDTMFAATSADDQTTIWDLSVEEDKEQQKNEIDLANLPPQLLFIHMGQKNVKEVHWHPQITNTLLTTAEDGLHIFKPSNL